MGEIPKFKIIQFYNQDRETKNDHNPRNNQIQSSQPLKLIL